MSYLWEFMRDGRTPMRALSDQAILLYAHRLSQSVSEVVELGSAGDYYKRRLAGILPVRTSNIVDGYDLKLDMTNLEFPSESVEALMSFYAIEHVVDYEASFREAHRILNYGGYYLLIAPFIYYYHAAPDDYFRFTSSALKVLADKHCFKVVDLQPLGDRGLLFAEFLHEKAIMGSRRSVLGRLLLRILAMPFLARSILRGRHDTRFAMGYACLFQK